MHMRDIRLFNESDGRAGNQFKMQRSEHVRKKAASSNRSQGELSIVGDHLRTHQAMSFVERQGAILTEMTHLQRSSGGRGRAMLEKR